ncbi:MAG: UTP--glucose-1-phosphate uridylyltransferase, partial [Clostridiales bacterium]|nr:UTP--glucose-1-phosphate uridylyltransferase [Clostridiales bacterium]
EKPQGEIPSQLTSLGRFILTPDIFRLIEKTPKKNGEVYLTDSMSMQAQTKGVYAYEFEGRRYDIGDKQGFLEAGIEFALRDEKLKDRLKEYLKNLVANL